MIHPISAAQVVSDPLVLFLSGLGLLVLFIWYFATESDRRKRNIGSILVVGLLTLCIAALIPPSKTLKGGIDIVGGSAFTLRVQPNVDPDTGEVIPLRTRDIERAIETIEKRLNAMGTSDMSTAQIGDNSIKLEMPGMDPESADAIRETLQKVAKLEFRAVNLRGSTPTGPNGESLAEMVYEEEEIVPGYEAYQYVDERDGEVIEEYLLLESRPIVDGSDVANAYPQSTGATHQVGIELTGEGGEKMFNYTKDLTVGRDRMAVLLDGEVIIAPGFRQVPLGKTFVIDGQDSYEQAGMIASQLNNPLKNELKIDEERTIAPKLGAAVVSQGLTSAAIGLAFTAVFILFYYRLAGLIALSALAVNAVLIFGGMAMFEFTFTLPGIAGIILTIGMAVDANVLIFERLREELSNGKSLANAINTAYEKAFSAIFDSNITSLIAAIILFWKASGTVAGFAVTLTIGLLGSMFSAILVTRVLFRWVLDLGILKHLSIVNLFAKTSFDFLGKRRTAFALSAILLVAALGGMGVRQGGALGVDFTGGTILTFQFDEDQDGVTAAEAREALKDLDTAAMPFPQEERIPGSGELLTIRAATEDAEAIEETLRANIPVLGERVPDVVNPGRSVLSYEFGEPGGPGTAEVGEALESLEFDTTPMVQEQLDEDGENVVGLVIRADEEDTGRIRETLAENLPTLAETDPTVLGPGGETGQTRWAIQTTTETVSATAGTAFLINSLIAIGLGMVAILIYISIRFEFSFALGAFAAVIHDVILAVGLVILFGGELSLIHVGAILTIAGYSINDTIIVFDRIRESLLTTPGKVEKIMNEAINATLSRTMITSVTTMVTVAILAIFGGAALREFSIMILVGLIVGTYSSIFVAAPVVLLSGKGKSLRRQVLETTLAGETAANT